MSPFFHLCSWFVGLLDLSYLLLKILGPLRPKFFRKGYGNRKIFNESTSVVAANADIPFIQDEDLEWGEVNNRSGFTIQEGRFRSPLSKVLPREAAFSKFHLVKPSNSVSAAPVYILMLPATGEMSPGTRLSMAGQLAQQRGWSSVVLTAPYYGSRRPPQQTLFYLDSVADFLLQRRAILEESAALADYFLKTASDTRVCFTGFSYGAAMATSASALSLKMGSDGARMACAAYVGSASPSSLTDGMLETSIDFAALRENNSEGQAKKSLHEFFRARQLENIGVPPGKQLAVAKGVAMSHDLFIQKQYSCDLERQIRKCLHPKFEMCWCPGGHVVALLMRRFWHKQLLIDTIEELCETKKE